jgi:DNA-binding beta-propeller fold protein YncE
MTLPDPNNIPNPDPVTEADFDELETADKRDKKKRYLLLATLLALLLMLCCAGALFTRYILRPQPLPEMLPLPVEVNYPPHYLFSIYGVDQPVGVALSPQGDRLYVSEMGGERLVKMFDREGELIGSFAPPRTRTAERSPVYLTTDSSGRVFVTDRLQHGIFVYDASGNYLDTLLSPDTTLSEYVAKHTGGLQAGQAFAYNAYEPNVYYGARDEVFERTPPGQVKDEGQGKPTFPAPSREGWSPLGVHFDDRDGMFITDVSTEDYSAVHQIPARMIMAPSWEEFQPPAQVFGAYGHGNGQFIFPNTTATDSQRRIYVTDGNNSRISVWKHDGQFLFNFGAGGDGALSLPRGASIDDRDRLYVVDAVGQNVKVYSVSGEEPRFLFNFGQQGEADGQFNFPNDIAFDAGGRLYIADRENNRVQVWSY